MDNSKLRTSPIQEKLKLSKSRGALTPAKIQRMQNVPYASAVGSIMYAVRCTCPDVAFAQNITTRFQTYSGYLTMLTTFKVLARICVRFNYVLLNGKAQNTVFLQLHLQLLNYSLLLNASKEAVWIRKIHFLGFSGGARPLFPAAKVTIFEKP
ncbi:hypothetical protein Tco_1465464 [Tanacetum coccineum]